MALKLIFAVVAGILASQFTHAVGAAPILAALLCAACFLRKRDVALIGIVAMLTRDVLVGVSWFTIVRVLAVISVVGIVRWLRVRPTFPSLFTGLMSAAPAYHLTLSVGDWVTHTCSTAPWTWQGLLATIQTSLPYFYRSFFGDVVVTGAFLGLYTFAGYVVTLQWPALLPHDAAPDSV